MTQFPEDYKTDEKVLFINQLKYGVWLLGIVAWSFAVVERTIAVYTNTYPVNQEIIQALITCFFLLTWFCLQPENPVLDNSHRSTDLRWSHLISQEYLLPFPYLCQVYHLLNLKHLETIHAFSLSNLKIDSVTDVQTTSQGGIIKFKTTLDSSFNLLRIWRQNSVEVDLILHNPYTVELSIPIYNQKRMVVFFNVLPLTTNEHYFFIDIYGNLEWWLRPLMQVLLHIAACLTLFEDLPYLRALSEGNIERLFYNSRSSKHKTMYLYNRYLELQACSSVITNG
ncbi:MAG: hypothetical protein IGS39_07830 [Calothrix sp. C42_A2020_038]|nr:hypothetical protein [Calothrix sp. C42_A2020_038]